MKVFLIVFIYFVSISCCHKKDCEDNYFPRIQFLFDTSETDEIILYKFDKIGNLIDSTSEYNFVNIYLNEYLINFEDYPYNFEFLQEGKLYSIGSIKFKMNSKKVKCNKCYPFGSTKVDEKRFESISYQLNDSVIIINNGQSNITHDYRSSYY